MPLRDTRADALVELAHQSLVDAQSATLFVERVGLVGDDAAGITLCERGGHPVVLCPASGTLAGIAAGGCAAVVTVPARAEARMDGAHNASDAMVVFLGRMSSTGIYGSGIERTMTLELVPVSIVIEPGLEGGAYEAVDLQRYSTNTCRATCPGSVSPISAEDWADESGGHRLALSFTSPATDPAALARSVRSALDGSR